MENKQTAVEWLESELKKQGFLYDLDIEAAKAMEIEQIKKAHELGSFGEPIIIKHFDGSYTKIEFSKL